MSPSLLQQLSNAATAAAELTPANEQEQAIVGFMLGAIYGLRRAIDLGFVDRTGAKTAPDYTQELQRVAHNLASKTDISDDHAWLSGFYFNSALHRIAALGERVSIYAGGRQDMTPKIRREVNRLKHDVDGLMAGRSIGVPEVVSAVCGLTTVCSLAFVSRR